MHRFTIAFALAVTLPACLDAASDQPVADDSSGPSLHGELPYQSNIARQDECEDLGWNRYCDGGTLIVNFDKLCHSSNGDWIQTTTFARPDPFTCPTN